MANETSADRFIIRAAMAAPYLERGEEHDLAVRWKEARDQQALHRLTQAHMRLVIALAGRFRSFGLPMPDLVQEGHVGLLEAAARFDPERNVRFSTYATWWIRASLQDFILRNWSIVRGGTSSNQKALFFNLRRLRARLSKDPSGRSETEMHEEIATAIGVPVADVQMMSARLAAPDTSLDAPLGDAAGGGERIDFLASAQPLQDEVAEGSIDGERRTAWLATALDALNERERRILSERRLAEDAATLEAIGARLGISKERVRQIESRAMEKLRLALARQHPELMTPA
jgi:RNA polymerase sigma-32 factor